MDSNYCKHSLIRKQNVCDTLLRFVKKYKSLRNIDNSQKKFANYRNFLKNMFIYKFNRYYSYKNDLDMLLKL